MRIHLSLVAIDLRLASAATELLHVPKADVAHVGHLLVALRKRVVISICIEEKSNSREPDQNGEPGGYQDDDLFI